MKKHSLLALLILLFSLNYIPADSQLADSPWPCFQHDARRTGRSPYTGSETAILKWKFKAGQSVDASPVIGADGTNYIGSWSYEDYIYFTSYLYASKSDGSPKWMFHAGDYSSPALCSDGTIYAGADDGYLYAINPDGTVKWRFKTNDAIMSSPIIGHDGTIYVGSKDENFYAIDNKGNRKWHINTDDTVLSSPAIDDKGNIYVGSSDMNIYALKPDGSKKWIVELAGAIEKAPAIGDDGTIYVATLWGFLYALNQNGTKLWMFEGDDYFRSSPAIGTDGTVYIGCKDGRLYAVNPDGTKKWHFKTRGPIDSSPAIDAKGTIYVGSEDSYLYAINPDGSEKWAYKTGDGITSSPAIGKDGIIYVGSDDGYFYAIGKEFQQEKIHFGLNIDPPDRSFKATGDSFKLLLDVQSASESIVIDFYFALLDHQSGILYFGLFWGTNPTAAIRNLEFPKNMNISRAPMVNITIPNDTPPIPGAGTYTFAIAATDPGTLDFISNIGSVSLLVK